MSAFRLTVAAVLAAFAVPAPASETFTYSYDALGRLVKVARAGSVNANATECYSYDKAANRSTVNIATASDCAAPPLIFSIASNGAVTEGGNSTFTVTLSGTPSGSVQISYATANGTAIAPGDYTTKAGTLTFAAAGSQSVSVITIDDVLVEATEAFTMMLSGATAGTIGSPTASASIADNDATGPCAGISYTINDVTVTEGAPLVFTVTKAGSTTSTCTVNYATANGTATTPTHYTATSGTLSFTSAQVTKTISVTTINNSRLNATLKMYVNLSAQSGGATIADSQGMGSIKASGDGCLTCRQTSGVTTDPGAAEPPPDQPE